MRALYLAVLAGLVATGESSADSCDIAIANQDHMSASDVIACILEQKTQLDQLRVELAIQAKTSAQIPTGAVLAFSREDGCPSGWSDVDEGQGRTIVGVDRTTYRLRFEGGKPVYQTGGSETHTLRVAEIPPHVHGIPHKRNTAPAPVDSGILGLADPLKTQPVEPAQDAVVQPHNNMPPYVALYWCKKE